MLPEVKALFEHYKLEPLPVEGTLIKALTDRIKNSVMESLGVTP